MAIKNKTKKLQASKAALFIPAGLLLGMGCGFLFNNPVAGIFIGLGTGMVVFAILTFIKK
ncbi:MAG: hypothetical protein WC010_04365 [Candidatus Absconditabacterales bacterium]